MNWRSSPAFRRRWRIAAARAIEREGAGAVTGNGWVVGILSPAKHYSPSGAPEVDQDRRPDEQDDGPQAAQAGGTKGYEDQRERNKVVAETVAELDPALAEMHEVHGADGKDGDRGAGRGAIDAKPSDRPPGQRREQIGRARPEDARACSLGYRHRTGPGEQAANRGVDAQLVTVVAGEDAGEVRQEPWRSQEEDAEVLRDIADIRDRPGRVVVEDGAVANQFHTVLVLVGGVEELTRDGVRIDDQSHDRHGRACPGEHRSAQPTAPTSHQDQERESEQDRESGSHRQPEEQARRDLARFGARQGAPEQGETSLQPLRMPSAQPPQSDHQHS